MKTGHWLYDINTWKYEHEAYKRSRCFELIMLWGSVLAAVVLSFTLF